VSLIAIVFEELIILILVQKLEIILFILNFIIGDNFLGPIFVVIVGLYVHIFLTKKIATDYVIFNIQNII